MHDLANITLRPSRTTMSSVFATSPGREDMRRRGWPTGYASCENSGVRMGKYKRAGPVAGNDEPRKRLSTLSSRSTHPAKSEPVEAQAPRRPGRPTGPKPFHKRTVRFDLAFFQAFQRLAPGMEPALAADFAAAMASPRGKMDVNLFGNFACARLGFEGLRRRGKYLQQLYTAEIDQLSADDAAWIDVSSHRLSTLYRAISDQSDDPVRRAAVEVIAASEFAALWAMGWGPTLVGIVERIGKASTTAIPEHAQGEHLAAIGEQLSGKKTAAGFNCPRFPANSSLPSEDVSEPSTDTQDMTPGLLRGIKQIAKYLELPAKQVERLHGSGDLPTFRIRSRICARKVTLDRWILEQERAGLAVQNGNEA